MHATMGDQSHGMHHPKRRLQRYSYFFTLSLLHAGQLAVLAAALLHALELGILGAISCYPSGLR